MLFEALPFALIFESAGGQAIDHLGRRLLDLKPEHHHDTTPCFFGSNYEIEKLKKAYGFEA
jgi:fructose-1,6-bisphosphatase I